MATGISTRILFRSVQSAQMQVNMSRYTVTYIVLRGYIHKDHVKIRPVCESVGQYVKVHGGKC